MIIRSAIRFPSAAESTLLIIILRLRFMLSTSVAITLIIPYASVMAVGSEVVMITTSSAAATKLSTFLDTPALVSMIIMSTSESVYISLINSLRSASAIFAIFAKPEAPTINLMPYSVSIIISDNFFCFLIT